MAKLVVTQGAGTGKSFEVARPLILGRQKGVNVLVDDIGASREHAKVFAQDGDYFVIDLNSRNGTKVNGTPVTRRRLDHGDTITIGNTSIRFDAPEVAPAAAPAAAAASASPATGAAAGAAPRGPSPLEQERARLASAAASKRASTGAPPVDDGSGVVVRETVLQYGRIENRGGLLKEDVGQRGGLTKLILVVVALGLCAGIAIVVSRALEKPTPSDDDPAETEDPAGGK